MQCKRNSSIRKHHERYIGIFSSSEKRLSLLNAQVSDQCPDSSHSCLKCRCFTKWIENNDAAFVFKEFDSAFVDSFDQLSESRERKVLGRAIPYLKAIATAAFLFSLEVINATLKQIAKKLLQRSSCKEAIGHQEIILTALDATSIISLKGVIQTFRDNKEIFVGLFRHAESVYGESMPMPRIVNLQVNRANPLAV